MLGGNDKFMKNFKAIFAILTATVLMLCVGCAGNQPAADPDDNGSYGEFSGGQTSTDTYAGRISAYLDGAAGDKAFVNYIKSLGEYDDTTVANNAVYASPNGSGNGTKNSPYDLQTALDEVKAGQTLYLLGGTYVPEDEAFYLVTQGKKDAYITIRPYPGERVKITNTNHGDELYGIMFDSTRYTVIEGIEIGNISASSAYGMAAWGSIDHVVIKSCVIHDIKTTKPNDTNAGANAILLFGENTTPISNIAVIDNECYNNETGWSETVSTTANCEYVFVLGNRIHDNTNIGIDFYGNAGYCSSPQYDQPRFCVAAGNEIYGISCPYADCAGLYVDGARDIILQYNKIYDCQYGIEIGSEERQDSYPVKNIIVRSNICYGNSVTGIRVGGYEQNATGVVYSTLIINNTLENNGRAQIIFAKTDGITVKNNLLLSEGNCLPFATDFNESYTKNLNFTNNMIFVHGVSANEVEFEMFNSTIRGIDGFDGKFGGKTIYTEFSLNADKSLPDSSPAIDGGAADEKAGNYDFALNARIKGEGIDIGAYETAR